MSKLVTFYRMISGVELVTISVDDDVDLEGMNQSEAYSLLKHSQVIATDIQCDRDLPHQAIPFEYARPHVDINESMRNTIDFKYKS